MKNTNSKSKELLSLWRTKLFDLGKRNQAINFKPYKASTLKIIAPDIQAFFNLLEEKKLRFADIFDHEKVSDTVEGQYYQYVNAQGIQVIKQEFYEYDDLVLAISKHKKKNKNCLYTNASSKNQQNALYHLNKRYRMFKDENAVHILYLALGFLSWYESKDSILELNAPLFLLPVKLHQKSFDAPFDLIIDNEDVILNETLLAKMEREYKLDFTFEIDNNKEIYTQYLNYKEKLLSQFNDKRWHFKDDIYLGLFSFNKINMVKDIEKNISNMANNPTIKKLVGEHIKDDIKIISPDELNGLIKPNNFFQPLDADASQEVAIQSALMGKSFVLQGPPGTGKSQTITNIISEFIARDKKVLFVAEKKAALDVVYNNLKKVGLEKFALPLHNQQIDKKLVIKDLVDTLDLNIAPTNKKFIEENYNETVKQLENYALLLLKKHQPLNLNLYELISKYQNYQLHQDLDFKIDNINEIDDITLNAIEREINQFYESFKNLNFNISNTIWHGFKKDNIRLDEETKFKKALNDSIQCLTNISEFLSQKKVFVKIKKTFNIKELNELLSLYSHFVDMPNIDTKLFEHNDIDTLIKQYDDLSALYNVKLETYEKIKDNFSEDVYKLDISKIKSHYLNATLFKKIFSKQYKIQSNHIKKYLLTKTDIDDTLLNNIESYQRSVELFNNAYNKLTYKTLDSNDYSHIKNSLLWIKTLHGYQKLKYLIFDNDTMIEQIEKIQKSKVSIKIIYGEFRKLFDLLTQNISLIQSYFKEKIVNFSKLSMNQLEEKLNLYIKNFDSLKPYMLYNQSIKRAKNYSLESFYEVIIHNKITSYYYPIYLKRLYLSLIDHVINTDDILKDFNRHTFDQLLLSYQAYDKKMIENSSKAIINERFEKIKNLDDSLYIQSIQTLKKESVKARKIKPLRVLFNEIPELILSLKPCLMMSPLSVSSYLNNPLYKFDLVIFDEASQVKPESALGAIYRSNQTIIVGDKEQLPPTNFFENIEDDAFDEFDEYDAFESILDLGHTALDTIPLKWHYRSKYESLISHSNEQIYQNLITFPASQKGMRREALEYIYVDGIYSDRKNEIEAMKVAELVFEHFDEFGDSRSLGVVTLSEAQQNACEVAINKKRRENPNYEIYFSDEKLEPFFIKNIETVQGDERDTIILTTTYGKDKKGKISLNFGPISRSGGYRRLNVATTRAKINMIVVSSLHASDIDLDRATSIGAQFFKKYLEYAESPNKDSTSSHSNIDSNYILNDIKDEIKKLGYKVDINVGVSKFKVDLAVKDKDNDNNYILAIDLDGSAYEKSPFIRDTNRLKSDILTLRGWKVHRIWALDWFKYKYQEIQKLKEILSK